MAPKKQNQTSGNAKVCGKSGTELQLKYLVKCINISYLDALSKPKEVHCCPVCQQEFPTFMTFWWHKQRHVGQDNFKCTVCDKVVDTPKACWTHELKVHGYAAKSFLYDPTKDPEQLSEPQGDDGKKVTSIVSQKPGSRMFCSEPQPETSKRSNSEPMVVQGHSETTEKLRDCEGSSTGSGPAKMSLGGSSRDRPTEELSDLCSIRTIQKAMKEMILDGSLSTEKGSGKESEQIGEI